MDTHRDSVTVRNAVAAAAAAARRLTASARWKHRWGREEETEKYTRNLVHMLKPFFFSFFIGGSICFLHTEQTVVCVCILLLAECVRVWARGVSSPRSHALPRLPCVYALDHPTAHLHRQPSVGTSYLHIYSCTQES